MSKAVDPKSDFIGMIVYEKRMASNPGKIIQDLGVGLTEKMKKATFVSKKRPERLVMVRFANGTERESQLSKLCDYQFLIDEHKRKYEKFSEIAEELREA